MIPVLAGERFGFLTVISSENYPYYSRKGKHLGQGRLCRCDCGVEKVIHKQGLLHSRTSSCGCRDYGKGANARTFNGYKGLSGRYYTKCKHNAKCRDLDFTVTKKYLWELFESQNKLCALSGVPLELPLSNADDHLRTASLDRIDNDEGYVPGNVQWIHKELNIMRGPLELDHFLEWCRKVAKHAQS